MFVATYSSPSMGCLNNWSIQTLRSEHFYVSSIFYAYTFCTHTKNVEFFFSPLFGPVFAHFRSNSFFCISGLFSIPIPQLNLSPFLGSAIDFFQNVFPFSINPRCFSQGWHWCKLWETIRGVLPQMGCCGLPIHQGGREPK